MTPKELARIGFGLARQYASEGDKYYFKDSNYDGNHVLASNLEEKANDILSIVGDSQLKEKMENCPLLTNAGDVSLSLDDGYEYFTRLYAAFAAFARSPESWETHFAANQQFYFDLWETPARLQREAAEKQRVLDEQRRLREAEQKSRFSKNLIEANQKFSQPARTAPCFAETRHNGLNCNRSDLIELKKFPTHLEARIKTDISIKICLRCRQLYKEIFAVDETNETFQNHFLKPGETDLRLGVNFSSGEAQEYAKIDFAQLVNPLLETENAAPESPNILPE